ncbi:MAG: ORF6N domain-containing protein [Bacteroidales bacterium]|nr:ORF6N domain-containing protein [Bacteroidales bacterium]
MYNAKDSLNNIEDRIFCIREVNVMIDRDLAEIYGVKTKRLNEQVKRNIERFPERYMFQLSDYETLKLVANCDRLQTLKHSSSNPYVFTEHGVSMLEDKQKLFFDGQIYDAFSLMVSIIQKANEEIILIDNYVNNETLDILSKKKETVDVRLFTSKTQNSRKQISSSLIPNIRI